LAPFDLGVATPATLDPGAYTLRYTVFNVDGGEPGPGLVLGVQEIDFTVAGAGPPPPPPGGVVSFVAETLSAQDDIELGGSSVTSTDLETVFPIVARLTVPAGVSNLTSVTSALVNFVAEDARSGTTTFTFAVRNSLDSVPLTQSIASGLVGETESVTFSQSFTGGQAINGLVDLDDVLNALIAAQGPLNTGDVINLVLTSTGARRDILQGSIELSISGGGGPTAALSSVVPLFIPDDEFLLKELEDPGPMLRQEAAPVEVDALAPPDPMGSYFSGDADLF